MEHRENYHTPTDPEILETPSEPERKSNEPPSEYVTEVINTFNEVQMARNILAELDNDAYQEAYANKWVESIERRIEELQNKIEAAQQSLNNRPDLDTLVRRSVEEQIIFLHGEQLYLQGRLERAPSEIDVELKIAEGSARRTIDDITWAIQYLCEIEKGARKKTPQELATILKLNAGWNVEAGRTAEKEQNILRFLHQAGAILAIPNQEEEVRIPTAAHNRLEKIIVDIGGSFIRTSPVFKEAIAQGTRVQWQAALDEALAIGLKNARANTRQQVIGDAKYVLEEM